MKHKRTIYLKMKTLAEARALLESEFPALRPGACETVPIVDAVGRVLAEPVYACISSPHFHSAAMDGIAVKAENTYGASEQAPRTLELGKNAFAVNTGHPLPPNTDAVIMIEHVNLTDGDRAVIEAPAYPWQYVRKIGEDIVATELLFAQHHRITPYCVGALLTGGIFSVSVITRPKVLIIPTGSEIVALQDLDLAALQPGQIIESNSHMLGKLIEQSGGVYEKHAVVADDPEALEKAVKEGLAADYDIIFMLGGSSAGSKDFSNHAISAASELLIHGVTIMPGKPLIVGKAAKKPIFGIPGYPVSAIIAFEQFVQPMLCRMQGLAEPGRAVIQVEPIRKIASKLGVEEFVRVKLGKVGERIVAIPLPRGAGNITTITEADGIIRIPNHVEGLREYEPARAELLKPLSEIHTNIVVVGSHDNTLDVLADELRAQNSRITLSSSHVGSMGGLMAIKKGVCHLAGSHLLDPQDGTYNVSYIKRYLPGIAVKQVHLVLREQGLIVRPGNPKGIRGLEDLCRPDITFISRQGGSGTRVLLDFRLKELGIDPAGISGYANEEFTHMSVAVAVLNGSADVGLGICAAARALKLDFIPVVTEEYDLIIPQVHFEDEKIRFLLATIRSERFIKRVEALGGYNTERTGEIANCN